MITVHVVGAGGVRADGPVSSHLNDFQEELLRLGFTPLSVRQQVRLAADLSRSMSQAGLFLGELDAGFVDEYLERRRGTRTAFHSRRALAHLLGWLAGNGLIPAAAAYPAPAVQDMRSSRPFTPTC